MITPPPMNPIPLTTPAAMPSDCWLARIRLRDDRKCGCADSDERVGLESGILVVPLTFDSDDRAVNESEQQPLGKFHFLIGASLVV
jgi:hypothetical protein